MKKGIRLFVVGSILFVLTSCGFKDIDKRFFVTAMGVDLSGDQAKPYLVTLKLAISRTQTQPGKEEFLIIQEKGATITEAVRLMKSKADKELEFGHAKVIVFGEKLARDNIKKTMDWFNRRRDIQKVAFVAVGSPDAESILKLKPKSEQIPGNALILSFAQEGANSAYILTEYLFDFNRRLTTPGIDPVLPVVEVGKESYNIRRAAIFDKTKLIYILTRDETRLLNELAFQISKFEGVVEAGDIKIAISFEKLSVKHKIVTPGQGTPYVLVKVKADGVVEEADKTLAKKDWKIYEKESEKSFEQRYSIVLKKIQKLGVDPIGFGEDYFASHFSGKSDWKAWTELYPQIDFRFKVKVGIKGPGNVY
ncbi:Ger(x)C family spore germination protein [Paenibacillus filicis]|uniref:Ger(X)C family spore germination protein n=1 Tax=Paenibacillus gyeongsangnamensis TaxID=3388067 RepID=A0ABT4QJL8_9BACL|nr:Ger(x)C family spore germination protein [Paenibacillus filicis]MCZ8517073.1 Ger(x)C family spore germination protein [Paenibacillus filicis]